MTGRAGRWLLAVAVLAAAMAPRASTWSGTFGQAVVLLEEVDPYYHLRRIELALANDLVVPAFDAYNNHPVGAAADWPPGFDMMLALLWHLLGNVLSVPVSPAAVGAVAVAVLGSLAAAGAALLASRWGGWAAVVAGLGVAWSPAAVAYSRVGRLDHHAIEPLCLVVICATYLWYRRRMSVGRAALLGGVLAAGTFFWIGAAFYGAALALAFGLEGWTAGVVQAEADGAAGAGGSRPSGPLASLPRDGAVAYAVAAAAAAGLAFLSPWGRGLEVVYYALSWFQPLLFAVLAVAFGVVAGLRARGMERRRAWGTGVAVLVLPAGLVLLAGSGSVDRGLAFLTGRDPVASTLLESRSLMETGPGYALRWLTPVALALPALWLTGLVGMVRGGRRDPLLAAAVALATLAAPFAFLQMRFAPHAAVVSGLLSAWLLAEVARRVAARGPGSTQTGGGVSGSTAGGGGAPGPGSTQTEGVVSGSTQVRGAAPGSMRAEGAAPGSTQAGGAAPGSVPPDGASPGRVRGRERSSVAGAGRTGWHTPERRAFAVAAGGTALLASSLAWGVRPATLPDSMVHPYVLGGFDALVWLRQAAPPTSHLWQPRERPEYGVAAEWVWGHWITQIGRKPNIANPLGQTPVNVRGVEEVAGLFLAESGAEARARLERLDVRYLLLSSIPATLPELAVQAGRDPDRYVVGTGGEGEDRNVRDAFQPAFFDTFHSRLYLGSGAGEEGTVPVPFVRLVFDSRVRIDFLGPRPTVRIFEVVPGATLRGRCDAERVEARAEVPSAGVVYAVEGVPEAGGDFALGMPYASEAAEAALPAVVTVRCGDRVMPVQVTERAVLEGLEVAVTRP